MPNFCILWQPRTRSRIVIIIVIYVTILHLVPHAAVPLVFGGFLGNWLTARPGRFRLAYSPAGDDSSC